MAELNVPQQISYLTNAKRNVLGDQLDYQIYTTGDAVVQNVCEYDSPKHFFVDYWFAFGFKAYICPVKDKVPEVGSLSDKYSAMMWKSSELIGVAIVPKNKE